MGRAARYSRQDILEAALNVLEKHGANGLKMSTIAAELGAPSGSLYHRYSSRDELVAELWLDTVEHFQAWFLKAYKEGLVAAASSVLSWSRENPQLARLIICHRREDLMQSEWPVGTQERAKSLNDKLKMALEDDFKTFGVQRLTFALVDIPCTAVKKALNEKRPPSRELEDLVKESARSLLRESCRKR